MKTVFILLLALWFGPLSGQTEKAIPKEKTVFEKQVALEEKAAVKRTIESFFEAFHKQDSTGIKRSVHKDIVMRRIAMDSLGAPSFKKQEFSEFLSAIVSIPENVQFKEVIKSYTIQIDGPLAQVWTPYTFLINDKMDHCGTNAFQLFKENTEWKIINIIDTGRKEGCE